MLRGQVATETNWSGAPLIECSYGQVYQEKVGKEKTVPSVYHYVNNISILQRVFFFKLDKQNKSESRTHTMTLKVSKFKKKTISDT